MSTIWVTVQNSGTGWIDTHAEPSSHTQRGVITGLSKVEAVVIATESATSPRARKTTTFEAVPPGQAPTRMTPRARSFGSPRPRARSHPPIGMTRYCRTTPMIKGLPAERRLFRSSPVSVSPIPSMIAARASGIQVLPGAAISGARYPHKAPSSTQTTKPSWMSLTQYGKDSLRFVLMLSVSVGKRQTPPLIPKWLSLL